MLAIESIINYYQEDDNKSQAPEGFCPNCWGHQKYEGQFLEQAKKENIDLKNVGDKKGWIQAYVTKNLTGILLKKEENKMVCTACKA